MESIRNIADISSRALALIRILRQVTIAWHPAGVVQAKCSIPISIRLRVAQVTLQVMGADSDHLVDHILRHGVCVELRTIWSVFTLHDSGREVPVAIFSCLRDSSVHECIIGWCLAYCAE